MFHFEIEKNVVERLARDCGDFDPHEKEAVKAELQKFADLFRSGHLAWYYSRNWYVMVGDNRFCNVKERDDKDAAFPIGMGELLSILFSDWKETVEFLGDWVYHGPAAPQLEGKLKKV